MKQPNTTFTVMVTFNVKMSIILMPLLNSNT